MHRSKSLFVLSAFVLSLLAGSFVWSVSSNMSLSAAFEDEDLSIRNSVKNLPKTDIACDVYDITLSTGQDIDNHVVSSYKGDSVSSKDRSYRDYDDEYALSKMSEPEIKYYRRLEDAGYNYITNASYDAYYVSTYNTYAIDGIQYSDLGLSKTKALDIAEYFVYNNPQYYFNKPSFLVSSQSVYITCYPDFADGDARMKTTESLFSVFDNMRESVISAGKSDYSRAVAAHNLICDFVSYESGAYDQSVYSALMHRKTVCAGYSELMAMLLNSCGVPTTVVASDMHAWNVVKLSGTYYGFDVTWDDSLGNYKYLAVSASDLKKYDNAKEHTAVSPWTEYAPVCSSFGYSGETTWDTTPDLSAPSVETFSSAENSVTLKWSPVTGALKYEYDLARDKSFKNTFNVNKETTSCSIKVINLKDNTTYYARVRSVGKSSSGFVYSDYTIIPFSYAKTVSLKAPVLKYSKSGDQSVSVYWDKVSGASQYQYDFSDDSSFSNCLVKDKKITANKITLTSLDINRDYYIRVRSVSGTYHSDYAVIKICIIVQAPNAPSVSLNSLSKGFAVSFSSQDKKVNFYYEIASDSLFNKILSKGSTSDTRVVYENTVPGKIYYVRAKAFKTTGSSKLYSAFSNVHQIKMPANISDTASGSKLSKPNVAVKCGSILLTIKWNKISEAQKYEYIVASDSSYKNVIVDKSTIGHMAMVSVSGFTGDRLYVKVRAVSGSDVSDWSSVTVKF